ncbi:MAG TPA: SDR family oxidoreductase [Acidimicrobiia bacterium]|nr:SDR family oxidoreductase [Acidimicrobiia bacterium]
MHDLSGHTSLITGGNGGIGLGLAEGILAAGGDVAIAARSTAKTEEAAAGLRARYPDRRILPLTCDVAQEEDVVTAVKACVAEFGRVDSCFANAGIGLSVRNVWEVSAEDWRRVMAVNLDGAFFTLKAAAAHMVERGGGGALVAVSSTSAIHGSPSQPHYATAKTGLLGLVRSFAVGLARYQIRVNALLPGWTATDLLEPARANPKFVENTTYRTPVRRWADPGEFAPVAAYLADPSITFHTGDSVVVDGGYTVF